MLLPFTLFASGFVAFKIAEPTCKPIGDAAHIFVLTGDARRIPFALEMLDGYPWRRLYIIGAGTPSLDVGFGRQIEIESESATTYENALAVRQIVEKRRLNSIVVVTTADHITRATYLIKNQLPDIVINACPVPLTDMEPSRQLERWIQEYVKFIGTLLGIQQKA